MAWQDQLKGDSLAWLLEPDSPGVRYLVLRDLLDRPKDDVRQEVAKLSAARKAAHTEGPIATILAEMNAAGFWAEPGPGYNPKYRSSVWSMIMLAQLGASVMEDERIARACAYFIDIPSLRVGNSPGLEPHPVLQIACKETSAGHWSSWATMTPGWKKPLNGWRVASRERE